MGLEVWLHGDLGELATYLERGTLQGASDGSVKKGKGTSAWRIEPKTYKELPRQYKHGAGSVTEMK